MGHKQKLLLVGWEEREKIPLYRKIKKYLHSVEISFEIDDYYASFAIAKAKIEDNRPICIILLNRSFIVSTPSGVADVINSFNRYSDNKGLSMSIGMSDQDKIRRNSYMIQNHVEDDNWHDVATIVNKFIID